MTKINNLGNGYISRPTIGTHQVKFTIPGPMTIADGVKNKHYEDIEHLHRHLSIFYIILS